MGHLNCYNKIVKSFERVFPMIMNLCLFVFVIYLLIKIFRMLTTKPPMRNKFKVHTPQGYVKVIYDEK